MQEVLFNNAAPPPPPPHTHTHTIEHTHKSTPMYDVSVITLSALRVGHEFSRGRQITNASDQWLGATVASDGPDGALVVSN